MGGLEPGEGNVTAMSWIDVEDNAPGGRCPDVCARKPRPPPPNCGGGGAGVLEPIGRDVWNGMLPWTFARRRVAGATAVRRPPDRKYRCAMLSVVQSRVEHRGWGYPSLPPVGPAAAPRAHP